MKHQNKGLFRRVLCAALAASMVFTAAWSTAGYGVSDRSRIVSDATPLVSGLDDLQEGQDLLTDVGADAAAPSLSMKDLGEGEARAAAEERSADPQELGYVPGEIVVIYEESASVDQTERALESVEGEEVSDQAEFDLGTVATVEISDGLTVEMAAEIIEADPAVKYAIPNYLAETYDSVWAEPLGSTSGLPSTGAEDYSKQWHLGAINASEAWDALASSGKSLTPVKVAVIDTGASITHSDLKNMLSKDSIEVVWTDRSNYASWKRGPLRGDGYTNGSTDIQDKSSHGTHVTGLIGAQSGNGGVMGVASGGATAVANKMVDIVAIDAFSLYKQQPNGTYAASAELNDIVFALRYAASRGCRVANMSLGFPATDASLNSFMEELTAELSNKNDMLLVAAAGNNGQNAPSVPAMCSNVVGVTSVSSSLERSSFSNYGAWCDIAAPGEALLSTLFYDGSRDTYGTMSGTSMACPVVAGVAAMVRAANPRLNAREVSDVLCSTAKQLPNAVGMGSGLVDAKRAISSALASTSAEPLSPPSPATKTPLPSAKKPAATKSPAPGWFEDGSIWRYVLPDGSYAKGWQYINGAWYYFDNSGIMATGWVSVAGAWYYLWGSGAMATGWVDVGGTWYYLYGSGAMATGWVNVGGAWYYLWGSGAMATGWVDVGGTWYYLYGSGAMASRTWVGNYYLRDSGAMAVNAWIGRYHVNSSGLWDATR